jgi:hypothetical protein
MYWAMTLGVASGAAIIGGAPGRRQLQRAPADFREATALAHCSDGAAAR